MGWNVKKQTADKSLDSFDFGPYFIDVSVFKGRHTRGDKSPGLVPATSPLKSTQGDWLQGLVPCSVHTRGLIGQVAFFHSAAFPM